MPNAWMIRAGEGGYLADKFAEGLVAIGWDVGDLTKIQSPDEIRSTYLAAYPHDKKGKASGAVAMLYKFRHDIKRGDWAVTYDPEKREYLVGEVTSDYIFEEKADYQHTRKVSWKHHASRDVLKPASKNYLGSTLTLFSVNEDVLDDLLSAAKGLGKSPAVADEESEKQQWQQVKEDLIGKAHELIKDKLLDLSEEEMPELVAALLRAMGFKTRISPKGPDRGVDVIASPDGLGFQEPRIKVEVKHRRNEQMGSQQIRSFLGALRPGDKGLYVSTGGFSKDAKYEAERANVPMTLVDLDELAKLVVDYYSKFDSEGQTLLPLVRVYWPND